MNDAQWMPLGDQGVEIRIAVDILENLYVGWTPVYRNYRGNHPISEQVVGKNGFAFGDEPAQGALPGQERISGYQGKRLINSKKRNLGTFIGELQSGIFTIQGHCCPTVEI